MPRAGADVVDLRTDDERALLEFHRTLELAVGRPLGCCTAALEQPFWDSCMILGDVPVYAPALLERQMAEGEGRAVLRMLDAWDDATYRADRIAAIEEVRDSASAPDRAAEAAIVLRLAGPVFTIEGPAKWTPL